MISLGWGSWKTRLITAWPLSRDFRWKLAGLPCLQKLRVWESWCWMKQWAVGVHCADPSADQGPFLPGPGDILAGTGAPPGWSWVRDSPSPLSLPSGLSLQPLLKKVIKLVSLVV